jgi:hypothetical protein
MAYSSADGWRLFLAYHTVFTDPHGHIRKSKKVREVIEQHRGFFQPLIRDFGFDKVADIVKTHLDQRVVKRHKSKMLLWPILGKIVRLRQVPLDARVQN